MATRLRSRFTEHLPPQLGGGRGFSFAAAGSMQCRQQTPCVARRPEQVGCFHQPGEFASRNESHISRPSAPDDDRLLLIHNLIQNGGQVLTQAGICGFRWHRPPLHYCTGFLYLRWTGSENHTSGPGGADPLVRAGRPRPAAGTTTSASCGTPAGRRGRRPRTRGSAPPILGDQFFMGFRGPKAHSNRPGGLSYGTMTMGARQKANFCAAGSSTVTWQV